jgi:hypothetical protein
MNNLYLGVSMPSTFTSLSSFSINEEEICKIEDELENLKSFSENDYPFQVQDMLNSILALTDDCSQKSRICSNFYDNLTIFETFSKHEDKKKVRLILERHDSVENLLKEANRELKEFRDKLRLCRDYLKEINDKVISRDELICEKCEGKGNLLKTRYVRERGSSPQPYTESIDCDRCDGKGKILLDSELKRQLLDFIQRIKPIKMKLELYVKTLENYLGNYEIPSLNGYDEIELIFPEDDPKNKKTQQSLSEFFSHKK